MRQLIAAAAFVPLLITMPFAATAQQSGTPAVQAASAPTPPAPTSGPRRGRGPHFGRDNTPGWSMMTRAERDEHREKMRNAQNRQECNAVMDEHRKNMAERARMRGQQRPMQPRRDACAGRFP